MRAISLMYELSGGCERGATCSECKYFEAVKRKNGFGKGVKGEDGGICYKHPLKELDWKGEWMACKYYRKQYEKIRREEKGQVKGQMTLDMFL